MTPDEARAMYRDQIAEHGETVVLRRDTPPAEVSPRARVLGYAAADLVGAIQQGDSRVIVLAEDVAGFPLPIRERSTDSIVIDGVVCRVQAVDARTRRVAGETIAFEIRVRG